MKQRTVITLDAGGTNLVFGAMRGHRYAVDPLTLPSRGDDVDACLDTMVRGFEHVRRALDCQADAISFAFPGPADYRAGIIGGYLPNFPSFRDGVALGPFLEDRFGLPVFINNDGDLYALGEATGGVLPEINARLERLGSPRRYRNLLGYTFGTGLGVGSVIDGRLNLGNNVCVESFCLPNALEPGLIAEEGAAIRAVRRDYALASGDGRDLSPLDIYRIARGDAPGDGEAARRAFARMGAVAGDAVATAVTLTDSLVVIGGGLTGAMEFIKPALLARMRSTLRTRSGDEVQRVQMQVYDLDDEQGFADFAAVHGRDVAVRGAGRTVHYDPVKRTGVATSRLGASQAIAIGAYEFAVASLGGAEGGVGKF